MVPSDPRVRPTADRVREAWLQILAAELAGSRVLDLFAGSGALGLEALSRGAAHVTFVDINPPSLAAIRANLTALDAEPLADVRRVDALRFVERLEPGSYDLALADPPFTGEIADRLVAQWVARPFAPVLAVEHPARISLPGGEERRWGEIAVTFFRAP